MTESNTQIYGIIFPYKIVQKARIVASMEGKHRSPLMQELLEIYLKEFDLPAVDKLTLTMQEKDGGTHERDM